MSALPEPAAHLNDAYATITAVAGTSATLREKTLGRGRLGNGTQATDQCGGRSDHRMALVSRRERIAPFAARDPRLLTRGQRHRALRPKGNDAPLEAQRVVSAKVREVSAGNAKVGDELTKHPDYGKSLSKSRKPVASAWRHMAHVLNGCQKDRR
jgi:hypothetical protein